MEITWLGNSTFLIKTSTSKRILIDPFNILGTFSNFPNADILTFSKVSDNYNLSEQNINSKIINYNSYKDDFIEIESHKTFNDSMNGLKRGSNLVHTYYIDNFKIAHLGYLGHMPNDEIVSKLQNIDFLFLPIGGRLCLSGKSAYSLSKLLNPKYIIPMCYKSSNSDFFFESPLDFLSNFNSIYRSNTNSILTTEINSSYFNSVLLLNK